MCHFRGFEEELNSPYGLKSKCVMIEYHNAKVFNHHSITRRGFKGRTHASDVSIMYCFIPYVLHANQ